MAGTLTIIAGFSSPWLRSCLDVQQDFFDAGVRHIGTDGLAVWSLSNTRRH